MTTKKTTKIQESKSAKKAKTAPAKEIKEVLDPMDRVKPRTFQEVGLSQIKVNPLNPRKNFSGQKYDELLSSVRTKGVIVPVLLRPLSDKSGYIFEIIAGERRFRASCEVAKANGGIEKARIPAIIQEMSDDEAYDCMTVENLQRADLTPLEEARAFKLYLDRKGPDALPDLAERIGINPCYIRRRTVILGLPEKILKAWEEGNLSYGHLEQLTRVAPEGLEECFDHTIRYEWTVRYLRTQIENQTPRLTTALFKTKGEQCSTCTNNTDIQRSLFGNDIGQKSLCMLPACFRSKQGEWIKENWEKYKNSRGISTNGFRFREDVRYDQYESMYGQTRSKCNACEHYVSLIQVSGSVDCKEACIGEKSCFNTLYRSSSKGAKKAADPNAPRVSWHGEYFREEFFKSRIPEIVNTLQSDDEKVLRIALLTILETHNEASQFFDKKYNSGKNSIRGYVRDPWPILESLQFTALRIIIQELSLLILMDSRTTTAPTRRLVAVHLGSDLTTEWRLTKEYLDKKTTKEIHAIAEQFGFFKDDKAKAYLYETLGKKRDRFDLCKKAELVKVILESGIDLSGKVPTEILK